MDVRDSLLTTALEGGIGYWALATKVVRDAELDVQYLQLVEEESAWLELSDGFWIDQNALAAAVENGDPRIAEFVHEINLEQAKEMFEKIVTNQIETNHTSQGVLAKEVAEWGREDADVDADAADMIVQMVCLGEVVYG